MGQAKGYGMTSSERHRLFALLIFTAMVIPFVAVFGVKLFFAYLAITIGYLLWITLAFIVASWLMSVWEQRMEDD